MRRFRSPGRRVSEPFIGELRIVSFAFAPRGWAQCGGQLLPINQNQALFSLLGTMYGGDGKVTFALPDLRGRVPMHVGAGFIQGQAGGSVQHTLTAAEMPAHAHGGGLAATTAAAGTGTGPVGARFANATSQPYRAPTAATQFATAPTGNAGSTQPHTNMQPYLPLVFCIALQGIFPPRN